MRVAAALVAFAASSALAIDASQSYDSSLDMTIDPGTVDAQTRATWCQGQTDTCTTLCSGTTKDNDCEGSDLSYKCTCSSNSSMPGLQYYTQTMPTYICYELFAQCIATNADQKSQDQCISNIQDLCATQDPPKRVADSSSTSTSASKTSSMSTATSAAATNSDDSDDDNVTTTSSDGFAAPTLMPMGNGAVAFAAMGVMAYVM